MSLFVSKDFFVFASVHQHNSSSHRKEIGGQKKSSVSVLTLLDSFPSSHYRLAELFYGRV